MNTEPELLNSIRGCLIFISIVLCIICGTTIVILSTLLESKPTREEEEEDYSDKP